MKFTASIPTQPLLEAILEAHAGEAWPQVQSWIEGGKIPETLAMWDVLERSAGALAKLENAADILAWLEANQASAALWLAAAMLEAQGRYDLAAERLRGIRNGLSGDVKAATMLASARCLLMAGKTSEAWHPLREAAKAAESAKLLRNAHRLLTKARKQEPSPSRRTMRIGLVGSFTTDFLAPLLEIRALAAGITADIYVGPFNQYQQEIINPNSGLAAFRPDLVWIMTDWRSLGLTDDDGDPRGTVEARLAGLETLWQTCGERLGAFVVQSNFEIPALDPMGRLGTSLEGGRARLLQNLNLQLWKTQQRRTGLAIFDLDHVAALWGKQRWFDPTTWHTSKQYPAPEAFGFLAQHMTALLSAVQGLTAKCVALDLDGVLWGGVIGEDGLDGIQLGGSATGEAFVEFQKYLRSLSQRGVLLAVCSKNNLEDGMAPFRTHPEMVLRETDIAYFAISWRSKDEGLREIAAALNIGADAIVFMDDNPMERARVRQHAPEVEVLDLPRDPAYYISALNRSLLFESLSLTSEDRARTASLRDNLERKALQQSAGGLDEYLADLHMQVKLAPFDEANLPRIVQLINKTNQFNLTTRRITDEEVHRLMREGAYTMSLRVSDRFGDSGLTGVLIAIREKDALRIDTWLMSCRVLGRRLDEVMFAALARYARAQGLRRIVGEFIPTAKNVQVEDLYLRLQFTAAGESGGSRWFEHTGSDVEFPAVIQYTDLTQEIFTGESFHA
jgi:FkbH-like protein